MTVHPISFDCSRYKTSLKLGDHFLLVELSDSRNFSSIILSPFSQMEAHIEHAVIRKSDDSFRKVRVASGIKI